MMLISFGEQKAEWKGTIEEENGVKVIKNPKEPMYGEDVFSLEEELSIGEAEGREEYMFSEIRSIAVDDEEKIYALDIMAAHVKVFDQNGNFMLTNGIGRRIQEGHRQADLRYSTINKRFSSSYWPSFNNLTFPSSFIIFPIKVAHYTVSKAWE